MKRMISILLAAVMALTPCLQAGAAAVSGMETVQEAGDEKSAPEAVPEMADAGKTEEGKGQVDVTIIPALTYGGDIDFTVSLEGSGKPKKEVKLEKQSDSKGTQTAKASFENLNGGKYTLKVSASGFLAYTQEITVENNRVHAVKLLAGGDIQGMNLEKAHPGVIWIGDVNGDGFVDDTDKALLTGMLDQKVPQDERGFYNLNRDEEVNLVDLEYFAGGASGQCQRGSLHGGGPYFGVGGRCILFYRHSDSCRQYRGTDEK